MTKKGRCRGSPGRITPAVRVFDLSLLAAAFAAEVCGWCHEPVAAHTADEYDRCRHAQRILVEGTAGAGGADE